MTRQRPRGGGITVQVAGMKCHRSWVKYEFSFLILDFFDIESLLISAFEYAINLLKDQPTR
jgi:hypothetical protein